MERRAFIIGADPRRPWLEARTWRSLGAAGFTRVAEPTDSCLLIRAGEVLRTPRACIAPPLPANNHLVAVGLPDSGPWMDFHRVHGGDYQDHGALPPPRGEWHSSRETALARLDGGVLDGAVRVVHWPPLDLSESQEAVRAWQIITSLQHGGAERIALELASRLPEHGLECRLVALGRGHRRCYSAPQGAIDLSAVPRKERARHLAELALKQGVDVLHVHLTDARETRELAESGIPVVATVHNARAGWPREWESLGGSRLSLMLACSQAVERELSAAMPRVPVRTVWNGIDPRSYPESPIPQLGNQVLLACVANPRPQKRLHLLPGILVAFQRRLEAIGRNDLTARLVIAGETAPDLMDAVATRAAVDREAERLGVADRIEWTEGKRPVHEVLRVAHALVSCSEYEGLSLAHLEALSMGRPVVACDVGGTSEIAWRNPALRLLEPDAPLERFAEELAGVVFSPPPSFHRGIWRDFSVDQMTRRVAGFLRQAACGPSDRSGTLWFVTNNLSTGGAQSSLRRLVKEFHQRGIRVRVALLQEYPEHPTAGRADLLDAGIPVFVPPPSGVITPGESVELVLAEMRGDPPACVVFWNVIAEHKLLLADALPFARVHDVSPGEMWFASMDACLANPPPGLPMRSSVDYGRLLSGLVVKYHAEAERMQPYRTDVRVIPNGVAPVPVVARPDREVGVVFGTAARISPQKHLEELIDAFRLAHPHLPGSVLRIAGGVETGADGYAARLRAASEGMPVEWLGEVNGLREFHESCDIFVMISDPAGCPNASLEALAAGLPVIATDVGGASEQVIDGVTGLLVQSRDPVAFAAAMRWLAGDAAARMRMGMAAREHANSRFSMDRMFRAYLDRFVPGHASQPVPLVR